MTAATVTRARLPRAERERQAVRLARTMFAERGYAAVTMDDVAGALGVTKPIVYRYFGNKDGLYLACLDSAGEALLRAVARAGQAAAPADRLTAGIAAFFAFLENDREAWRVLFDDSRPPGGAAAERVGHYRDRLTRMVAAALREAAPARPAPEVEALSAALLAAAEATGRWWLGARAMSAAQAAELLTAALVPGLLGRAAD